MCLKWTSLAALLIFEVGSVICGVAKSSAVLILGRWSNNHERELDQWKALLVAADKGLRLRQVIAPFGSAMSLLEVDMTGAVQEENTEEEVWEING
ncbi:hypothetical protein RRF57_008140 [Xylaria bambusicola]|uniref:Uncharacterized protein n=1 Tax=Xylaria bambusicola TaxID=326684 RepID=A0AAN7UUT8_9PEZI